MSRPQPTAYRLFTFHLDGRLSTLVLTHLPHLSPDENAVELYRRFHAIMEQTAPGCFREDRISHLGYVDGVRQPGSPESNRDGNRHHRV